MTTKQRVIGFVASAVCAVAIAPSASAEAQRGFFVGLSGGQSSFDIEKDELDGLVLNVFASQGFPVLAGSSTFADRDTTLAVVAGYRFLPYIAVEASYLDLGTVEYRSSGLVNPPGPVLSAPAAVDIDVASKGFTLSAVGSIPVGHVVDLHGRLGFLVAETELSQVVRLGTAVAVGSESLDSQGVLFGAGAGFHLGAHWSLSVDWTRYDNVGDENEDNDLETEAGVDIDSLSLSATFRF